VAFLPAEAGLHFLLKQPVGDVGALEELGVVRDGTVVTVQRLRQLGRPRVQIPTGDAATAPPCRSTWPGPANQSLRCS